MNQQKETSREILEIKDLTVCFGANTVLRDLNITVSRGETLAIIGESGCGKTVLLKNMIALLRPTSGSIFFDGNDLMKMTEDQLALVRRRYGFVFQQAALFDSMTIYENLAFPRIQHTEDTKEEIQEIIRNLLREVGLKENVLKRKPAELSGGMRKRVGIARALVMNPELMLYDEPTTGLDPIMTDVINELILRTSVEHPVTSVVVTHDMSTVRKVADRVIMLYPLSRLSKTESQILYEGRPEGMEESSDERVRQFVRGDGSARFSEMEDEN
ncbi:MAG: ABC transporter ATP-binding protein [Planctomycetia bacterium]|nr:ABC transporter ATP-binding protein [Planctomycetia bacterium]